MLMENSAVKILGRLENVELSEAYKTKSNGSLDVIEIGEYKGHRYEIGFTFGPVAYVEMDNGLTDEEAYEIPVHGGVTFKCYGAEEGKRCEDDFIENEKFYIGWDYQHFGDKSVYSFGPSLEGKEWTRDEIVAEIYAVIDLLERKK